MSPQLVYVYARAPRAQKTRSAQSMLQFSKQQNSVYIVVDIVTLVGAFCLSNVSRAMSSSLGSLCNELFKQYKVLYDTKTGLKAQQDFNDIWAEAKAKYVMKDELTKFAKNLLADYRQRYSVRKSSNILYYYTAASKQVNTTN